MENNKDIIKRFFQGDRAVVALEENNYKKLLDIFENFCYKNNYGPRESVASSFIEILDKAFPDFRENFIEIIKDDMRNYIHTTPIETILSTSSNYKIKGFRSKSEFISYLISELSFSMVNFTYIINSDLIYGPLINYSNVFGYTFFGNIAKDLFESYVLADKCIYTSDKEDAIRPFILNNKDYVIMDNDDNILLDDMEEIIHFKTYKDAIDYIDNVLMSESGYFITQ